LSKLERWKTWGKNAVVLFVIDSIVFLFFVLILSAYGVKPERYVLGDKIITNFFIATQIMVLVIVLGIEYLRWYFKYQESTKLYLYTYGARTILFISAMLAMSSSKGSAFFIVLNCILVLDIVSYYVIDFVEKINSSIKSDETQKLYMFWISFLALFFSFVSILVSAIK
jgi:uncharacterized membrane protein YdcZ (DUF606 family)